MTFLLRCVFLCSAPCLGSLGLCSGNGFPVVQTPYLEVTEHETARIECCWDRHSTGWRVEWYKGAVKIRDDNKNVRKPNDSVTCPRSLRRETCNCSTLMLPNVSRADSGRYSCKVLIEKPAFCESEGNGSSIRVAPRTSNGSSRHEPSSAPASPHVALAVSLGVVGAVFGVALAGFWILRRRGSGGAARVIYEAPHRNSEEAVTTEHGKTPGEDGHSTSSSSGSTQWCQVLVYESFSYFEAMENKSSE